MPGARVSRSSSSQTDKVREARSMRTSLPSQLSAASNWPGAKGVSPLANWTPSSVIQGEPSPLDGSNRQSTGGAPPGSPTATNKWPLLMAKPVGGAVNCRQVFTSPCGETRSSRASERTETAMDWSGSTARFSTKVPAGHSATMRLETGWLGAGSCAGRLGGRVRIACMVCSVERGLVEEILHLCIEGHRRIWILGKFVAGNR